MSKSRPTCYGKKQIACTRATDSAEAHKVSSLLLSTSQYQQAQRIGVYLSIDGKELATSNIVRDALNTGKDVFVPYIHKLNGVQTMDMLRLLSQQDYDSLRRDSWGIPSLSKSDVKDRLNCLGGNGPSGKDKFPQSDALDISPLGLDLLVMPGLAFDRKFNRLGHGRGYYDKYLARYQNLLDKVPPLSTSLPSFVYLQLLITFC